MNFEIKPATRQGIIPLVGFYGKSGSGKTMSALLFARGLAGKAGRITLIDTENKRGSIFADIPAIGGYDVLDMDVPFSPDRYQEAIVFAEAKSDVIVVDTLSHEWSGEGGVLDMADAELERMGGNDSNKMRSWIKPKAAHKMMVQRLLRSKVPLICCLRGEEKTHVLKGDNNKSRVVTDDFSSPLFDPRFIFEMLINFETVQVNGQGGFIIPRKLTHPDIGKLLPAYNEQITARHGEAVAAWCRQDGKPAAPANPINPKTLPTATGQTKTALVLSTLKLELWKLTKDIHHGEPRLLEQWLIDEAIIMDTETLESLTEADLAHVIEKARKKLTP